MRKLVGGVLFVGACVLLPTISASASGTGHIDHVEVAQDGTVQMIFSVPGLAEGSSVEPDSVRVEVDGHRVEASASPVDGGEVERAAILALDVSDSMRGERFAAAKDAALTYLAAAPNDVSIGLVTFAGSVEAVHAPTRDHDAVAEQVASLQLSRGTMLYDGVLESLAQAGHDGLRQVVVLSDGADTGGTPLGSVVRRARASEITVNVVALEQSTENQAKLRQITEATGGTVLQAGNPAALAAVFEQEAEALAQQVLIEFPSPNTREATVTASVVAAGESYSDSTFATLGVAAPPQNSASNSPVPARPPAFVAEEGFLVGGLAAIGIGVASIAAVLLFGRSRGRHSLLEQRLAGYTQAALAGQEGPGTPNHRSPISVRDSAVALAGHVVKRGDLESRLSAKLTAAGMSLTAAEWLLLHTGVAAIAALVGLMLGGGSLLPIVVLLLLGAAGPWIFLTLKRSRRVKSFNGQLADTLQLMAGGLSAGLSLPQAVDTVVREGSEPMAGELKRALIEQRLGVDIEDALEGVGERMASDDFGWIVMAIRIQREVGGNLAELLNTVAGTLREREYLRRQVLTLSAEGRLSAWILGGLPPAFVAYLAVAQPEYLKPMISDPLGWVMSAVAGGMLGVGAFWLAKTVKVEV